MDHENIYERRHSCKWYFDEAIAKYDAIVKGGKGGNEDRFDLNTLVKAILENGLTQRVGDKKIKIPTFLAFKDPKNPILKGSLFPLFLMPIKEKDDGGEDEDANAKPSEIDSLFEKKKFEICKVLNAIDSIVDRICGNSMEASFTETDDGHFVSRETVLKWLFAENDSTHYTIQDRDRAHVFCEQAYIWLKEHTTLDKDAESVDETLALMKEFNFKSNRLDEDEFIGKMRACLGKTIEEIHDLYHSLSGFRKYAIRADLAKPEMKKEQSLNKLLALSQAILNFFLTVCSSYMRIDRLNLPRADFCDARLNYSNVSDSNFASSNFFHVSFYRANAKNCDFSMASLKEINGVESDFSSSLFSYADLSGATFKSANLSGAKIDYANLGKKDSKALDDIIDATIRGDNGTHQLEEYLSTIRKNCETKDLKEINNVLQDIQNQIIKGVNTEEPFEKEINRFALHDKSKETFDNVSKLFHDVDRFGEAISVDKETYDGIREELDKIAKTTTFPIDVPSRVVVLENVTADNVAIPSADFSIVNFSGASFKNAQLPNLKAAHADGSGSVFDGANFYNAFFYADNFNQSSFVGASAGQAKIINCDFQGANFDNASFVNSLFLGTREVHYLEKYLTISSDYVHGVRDDEIYRLPEPTKKPEMDQQLNSALVNCSMSNVNATGSFFLSTDFDRSTLIGASFRKSILYNCAAISTNWDGANITFSLHLDCLYTKSSFRGSALYDSKFTNCEFSQCSFARAQMFDCVFSRCSFINSYLGEANLTHSVFRNCVFYRTIFTDAMWASAIFENCLFIEISMEAMNGLRTAVFNDSMFVKCTYNKAPLKETRGEESTLVLLSEGRKTLFASNQGSESAFLKYSDKK